MSLQEHFAKELAFIRQSGCHQLFTPEGCIYCSTELLPRESPINLGRGVCYPQFAERVIKFDGIVDGKAHLGTILTHLTQTNTATAESSW
jgi:hypothetical protein